MLGLMPSFYSLLKNNFMYTQGKWRVTQAGCDNLTEEYAAWTNRYHIIGVKGDDATRNERDEANARLIAAAPDLLEALTGLYTKFKNEGLGADKWYGPIMGAAKQAIKKATEGN